MNKKIITIVYIVAVLVIILGVATLASGAVKADRPNFPPGFENVGKEWSTDGYFFVTEKYWDNAYLAVFQQPWQRQPWSFGLSGKDSPISTALVGVFLAEKKEKWEGICAIEVVADGGGYGILTKTDVGLYQINPTSYGVLLSKFEFSKHFRRAGFWEINGCDTKLLFTIPTHYDNYNKVEKGKRYSIDITIAPVWNKETNSLDFHLSLTEKGNPFLEQDFENMKDLLNLFGNNKEARLIYENGVYLKAD